MSLEIDHVTKRFGATVALDGLAFEVAQGEVFGFLGANGAGKTTTMRICLGIVRADAGEIRWDGRPTGQLPRRTWGYLPEERGLYPRMNVLDQLVYYGSLYGETPERAKREALAWLTRFRIPEYADRRAEELSKGNQQKVQFIAAVLHGPDVLLMDEPFTGLDPVNLVLLREAFMELRDRGRTLIFSTHQMETAEAMCESVAIVDRGRLVAGGRVRDLKRASGRRSLRLAVDGDVAPTWLAELPGVDGIRAVAGGSELELSPRRRPGRRPLGRPRPGPLGHPVRGRGAEPGGAVHRARRAARRRIGNPGPRGRDVVAPGRRRGLMGDRDPLFPNAAIVARREYRDRVRGPLFLASTVVLMGLAALVAVAPIAIRYFDRQTVTRIVVVSSDAGLADRATAVADRLLNIPPDGVDVATWRKPYSIEQSADGPAADAALAAGELSGVLVVDRLPNGQVDVALRSYEGAGSARAQLLALASFGIGVLDWSSRLPSGSAVDPFITPNFHVDALNTATEGGRPLGAQEAASRAFLGIVFVVLLFITVVIYGMWVATGVASEKSSRVMELMISAASPRQMLTGKVVGIGAAGLTQYVAIAVPALLLIAFQDQIAEAVLGPGWAEGAPLGRPVAGPARGLRRVLPARVRAVRPDLRRDGLVRQPAGRSPDVVIAAQPAGDRRLPDRDRRARWRIRPAG